jgi:uncharacterized membrane protein YphA (DoxX/SURF4 family)
MEMIKKHIHSPSLGLFIIRLVAGTIFMFHGIQKLSDMEGTIAFFGSLGFGAFLAWAVAIIETVGGFALIIGYFNKFFSALLGIIMLVAIFKVKWAAGFSKMEIDLMLLATTIATLFSGCGRYSVCGWRHKNCNDCKDGKCGCQHGM